MCCEEEVPKREGGGGRGNRTSVCVVWFVLHQLRVTGGVALFQFQFCICSTAANNMAILSQTNEWDEPMYDIYSTNIRTCTHRSRFNCKLSFEDFSKCCSFVSHFESWFVIEAYISPAELRVGDEA